MRWDFPTSAFCPHDVSWSVCDMTHVHAAAVRCRDPFVHNAMRTMGILFGTESAFTPGQKYGVISAELRSKVLRLGTKRQGTCPNMRNCFSAATLIPLHRLT